MNEGLSLNMFHVGKLYFPSRGMLVRYACLETFSSEVKYALDGPKKCYADSQIIQHSFLAISQKETLD